MAQDDDGELPAETDIGMSLPGLDGLPGVPDYLSVELILLLQTFTLETERYIATLGRKHGMTHRDLQAVNAVINAERFSSPMTPGALMSQLSLGSAATSALIDRLGEAGHLVRARSEVDRRHVLLSVTDCARETGASVFGPLALELLQVFARHSSEDLRVLERFVAELTDATVAAREGATKIDRASSSLEKHK